MAQDIEEFLRMAAARKKQQAQQGDQAPPTNQLDPPAQISAQQPRPAQNRPSHQPLSSQQREPDIYIGMESPDQTYSHPNLESSIRSTVSTEDIAEQTSHLGERVHGRQEEVQSRVEQKFDHDLGRLQKRELVETSVVDHGQGKENQPDLSFVGRMLLNPASAKQAFILKEIFDRPTF